jgi:hypothetical protein
MTDTNETTKTKNANEIIPEIVTRITACVHKEVEAYRAAVATIPLAGAVLTPEEGQEAGKQLRVAGTSLARILFLGDELAKMGQEAMSSLFIDPVKGTPNEMAGLLTAKIVALTEAGRVQREVSEIIQAVLVEKGIIQAETAKETCCDDHA